jgi:heptosyltransferase-2
MEILMSVLNKILIIQTAFPGDAILTLPFIQELKRKKPDYLIDVLCIPSTSEIFTASPYVNTVISFDKKGKQKSFAAFLKFVNELKSNHYKIVYSPHRSFRSALIALNLSAKESYGFDNSSLKFAFKNIVKYDHSSHEVKRNLSLLNSDYSNDKWKIIPEIVITDESRIKVQKYLSDNQLKKFIIIAPGSVWETKKYPKEYYKQIADHFNDSGYQIVLIGGVNDRNLCEEFIKNDEQNIFVAAREFSFIESIELLKKSLLLICNDSAPTHLGVCADIPVLTIYCSTVANFGFYPYNSKSDYISYDALFCKPCGIHGFNKCPLSTFDCANQLTPEAVIQKAEKLLANAE